jgi:flavodoxin
VCVSVSHGNTRKVADAMADVLAADVRTPAEIAPAAVAEYELVGVGSGVFAMAPHPEIAAFVDRLPRVDGVRAFVFATSGLGRILTRPGTRSLAARLRDKGFRVGDSFCCRGYDTWLPLRLVGGLNKGRPNTTDLDHARAFARRLVADTGSA